MKTLRIAAVLLIAIASQSAALAASKDERLGRLFYTPEQRAELARQRVHRPQDPNVPGSRITLNGRVTRSDGKTTEWMNGQSTQSRTPGVKVGDSIDPDTGMVQRDPNEGRVEVKTREPR